MQKIIVENLSKKFVMETEKSNGALYKTLSFFSKKNSIELIAVDNASFYVDSGEILGIIGRNGSGKSTLLKIIAGIYPADSGSIKFYGESIYLNGFGSGLNLKLTMKENIYLMGAIFGLSKKEIKEKFGQIIDFSGLYRFKNSKVFQFSTGMVARLVFSATMAFLEHKKPEIILLDEIFESGGVIDFRTKASKKMEDFIKNGMAVILVSHDLNIIKKYCRRVLWMELGKIKETGPAEEIIKKYQFQKI